MAKHMTAGEAVKAYIESGSSIMVGGFYSVGAPEDIIDEIMLQDRRELTIINNDCGEPGRGVGKLLYGGRVARLIASWCGLTPIAGELAEAGKLDLEFNPQGTFVERIRAGGYGLGGVLTSVGLNTMVEKKWGERVRLNGRDFLYHTPLRADIAIVEAYRADEAGNLVFYRSQRNFCPAMCFAADAVIASVVNPVGELGSIDPDEVDVPGPLVTVLVQKGGQ